jgi:hypothetical protein
MNYFYQVKAVRLLAILTVAVLTSCSNLPPKPSSPKEAVKEGMVVKEPIALNLVAFETAISQLTRRLLEQTQGKVNLPTGVKTIQVALTPFVNAANNEEVVEASRRIEPIILAEGQKGFANFTLVLGTPFAVKGATYVLGGTVAVDKVEPSKYRQIVATVTQLTTRRIVAEANVTVLASDLANTSPPVYQNSPVVLEEQPMQLVNTAVTVEELPKKAHYNSLATEQLLDEADVNYAKKEYKLALLLYRLAAQRQNGQTGRTYAGLYQTELKLSEQTEAEKAFARLLAINIAEKKNLNLKFLFEPQSTDFLADKELRTEYDFWLTQIGKYFSKNYQCFHVIGYSKPMDDVKWPLLRAQHVQQLITKNFPDVTPRVKVITQNETDEGMLAILTRRVEVAIVDCSAIRTDSAITTT